MVYVLVRSDYNVIKNVVTIPILTKPTQLLHDDRG